ncbi:MAG: PIN domain nuclease [Dehalococcoidia bacterium]
MSAFVLDAGALIAVDRGDRDVVADLSRARLRGIGFRTTGIVVAQAWRSGGRQAELARLLASADVQPVDQAMGRAAGALLGRARLQDAIDATVVLVAQDGDTIVTSDVEDIDHLATHLGRRVSVMRC